MWQSAGRLQVILHGGSGNRKLSGAVDQAMKILGIQDGHSASAAIVEDGRILAAVQEERLTRFEEPGGIPGAGDLRSPPNSGACTRRRRGSRVRGQERIEPGRRQRGSVPGQPKIL